MTNTTTTTGLGRRSTVERYLAFWNAETSGERRRLAAEVFADGLEYHAPLAAMSGVEALIDFGTEFTEHMGRVDYRARTAPDHHHDRARLRWEIVLADGTSFATGTDVMNLAPDGRITSVTTFLDRAPEGFVQHEHEAATDPPA